MLGRFSALFGSASASLCLVLACATGEEDFPPGSGGTPAAGGDVGAGGTTGGSVATGGLARTGGAVITGGSANTGGVAGPTGGVSTTGGATATGGRSTTTGGTPAAGEDGAECLWASECNSGICIARTRRCGCGNGAQDGTETGPDCGGDCPPCAGSPCGTTDPPCGGGSVCETVSNLCTPYCLNGWRDTASGQSCLAETQPDRADCARMLDCMLARTCGPAPCDTCVEDPQHGAMGRILANEVFAALCP